MRSRTNLISKFVSPLLVILLLGMPAVAEGDELGIWDNGASTWTATFADGDPIDNGTVNHAFYPQIALDSAGRVYVAFSQYENPNYRIYLSRYDGTDVKIWDNDTSSWTDTFTDGDAIDSGIGSQYPTAIAVDSADRVYVAFQRDPGLGGEKHIYLSRYDGTDVKIWDNDTSSWTDTFADGDPIDRGTANSAHRPQIAVDSSDRVYVAFIQHDGANDHLYLSRYDGTDVKIWDNDTSSWTDTLADGDPIDTGTANGAQYPAMTIDTSGRVYLTWYQPRLGAEYHIYLSRYDGTDVKIWDNDTSSWTDTFANGDPIDKGTANFSYYPVLAADSSGKVYVAFLQNVGGNNDIYLSRYDGTDMKIWDNDTSSWTDTFADGDPIDKGTANHSHSATIAIDSADRVYVAYHENDGANDHVYLSRYDGTDVKIWDNDTSSWTDTFADGDYIDRGTANGGRDPAVAIDSSGRAYVTFAQSDGARERIYLSRSDSPLPSPPPGSGGPGGDGCFIMVIGSN